MTKLDDIATERRIVKESCSSVHPEADMYCVGGHEVEYLLLDRQQLKGLILEIANTCKQTGYPQFGVAINLVELIEKLGEL